MGWARPNVLGVDSKHYFQPSFLSKKTTVSPESLDGVLKRMIPGKNGEASPRTVLIWFPKSLSLFREELLNCDCKGVHSKIGSRNNKVRGVFLLAGFFSISV